MKRMLRTFPIVAIALAGPMLAGCATRGWVRSHLESLRESVYGEQAELRARLDGTDAAATEALARAELAYGGAGEARDLALGRHGYREVEAFTVYFAVGSAELDDAARLTLDVAIRQIHARPELLADIYGYADRTGSTEANLILGRNRAESVRRHLAAQFPSMLSRFQVLSFGEEQSVGEQDTIAGRAENRRVVVSLVSRARIPEAITQSHLGTVPR